MFKTNESFSHLTVGMVKSGHFILTRMILEVGNGEIATKIIYEGDYRNIL